MQTNSHAVLVNVINAGLVDAQRYFPFVGQYAKDMLLVMNNLNYFTLEVVDGEVIKTPVRAMQAEAIRQNRGWINC